MVLFELEDVVSLALETNGKGHLGFVVDLPGAFVRGRTEFEAVSKVSPEIGTYLKWLGLEAKDDYRILVVQRFRSEAVVEDADTEILLDADKQEVDGTEWKNLLELTRLSADTLFRLYKDAANKDWVDITRIRKTFYGDNPTTINQIYGHVRRCQFYYLTAVGIDEEIEGNLNQTREFCLEKADGLFQKDNNSRIYDVQGERWTVKKVLRRLVWHDRIHAKAITRILAKQKKLGMIEAHHDPFCFNL